MKEPRLEHLYDMHADLEAPQVIGATPMGTRQIFIVKGGTVEGPRIKGKLLPGGGDWALFRVDGSMILDVRLTLRTHDDALVHMTYGGRWIIPPELRADLTDPVKRYRIEPARYYF